MTVPGLDHGDRRAPRDQTTAALHGANLGGFEIEWLLLRPCVFPASLVRNLSVIATLGSGFVIEIEQGRRIYTEHGEIYLLSPSLRRRARFRSAVALRITYGNALYPKWRRRSA